MESRRTVVVGASAKRERFSNKALRMLKEYGHTVVPIHPVLKEIEDLTVTPSLEQVIEPVDTVTLYVNASISAGLGYELLRIKPKRVIFNPGAENAALRAILESSDIACVEACTLVMLQTGQY